LPSVIKGDLDSVRPEVLTFYKVRCLCCAMCSLGARTCSQAWTRRLAHGQPVWPFQSL